MNEQQGQELMALVAEWQRSNKAAMEASDTAFQFACAATEAAREADKAWEALLAFLRKTKGGE